MVNSSLNFRDHSKKVSPHLTAEVCKEMCFQVFQSGWISQCKTPRDLCKSRPRNEGLIQSFIRSEYMCC